LVNWAFFFLTCPPYLVFFSLFFLWYLVGIMRKRLLCEDNHLRWGGRAFRRRCLLPLRGPSFGNATILMHYPTLNHYLVLLIEPQLKSFTFRGDTHLYALSVGGPYQLSFYRFSRVLLNGTIYSHMPTSGLVPTLYLTTSLVVL
jgi:hypothetical protein